MTTQEIINSLEKSREELVTMFFNSLSENMATRIEVSIASIDRRLERERAKL